MKLVRVRDCDGACCRAGPRFPTEDGKDCRFRDPAGPERGCTIMRGDAEIPEGNCPALPHMTAREAYEWSCRDWPHNMPGRDTGDCCWQWRQ